MTHRSDCDYCGEDAATCGGQLCVSAGCLEPMRCSERCQRERCPESGMCQMHPECCRYEHREEAHPGCSHMDDEREYARMRGDEWRRS